MELQEWESTFQPIINHIDPNASWQSNEKGGIMFETYGEEIDYVVNVANTEPHKVWTWIDADGGSYIVEGYQLVNRIGYFITKEKWSDDIDYSIKTP